MRGCVSSGRQWGGEGRPWTFFSHEEPLVAVNEHVPESSHESPGNFGIPGAILLGYPFASPITSKLRMTASCVFSSRWKAASPSRI